MKSKQHRVDRADTGWNYSGQKAVSAYSREFFGTSPRLYVGYRFIVGIKRTGSHVEPNCVQIELHAGNGDSVLIGDLGCRIRARWFCRLGAGRLTRS